MTGRENKKQKTKKKTKKLIALLLFYGWSISEAYPTQYCCNLRVRHPRVRVQILRQAEA